MIQNMSRRRDKMGHFLIHCFMRTGEIFMDKISPGPTQNAGIPNSPKLMGREYYEDEFKQDPGRVGKIHKQPGSGGCLRRSPRISLASWVRTREKRLGPRNAAVHQYSEVMILDNLLTQNDDFHHHQQALYEKSLPLFGRVRFPCRPVRPGWLYPGDYRRS